MQNGSKNTQQILHNQQVEQQNYLNKYMAAGRPTSYTEDMPKMVRAYLDSCEDVESEDGSGKARLSVNIPSIEGLAYEIKINKDTIYGWCKIHPEFSDSIHALRAKQARALVNKGLSGQYNSTIAKVLLAHHGYRDAIDTDHTSKGESISKQMDPTDPEILAKLVDIQKTIESKL